MLQGPVLAGFLTGRWYECDGRWSDLTHSVLALWAGAHCCSGAYFFLCVSCCCLVQVCVNCVNEGSVPAAEEIAQQIKEMGGDAMVFPANCAKVSNGGAYRQTTWLLAIFC